VAKFSVLHGRPFCVLVIGLFPLVHNLAAAAPPSAAQVELGRHLFTRVWEPQLGNPESGDGLGPLFNGRSCAECHHQGGVGGGGSAHHDVDFIQPFVPGTESESYLTQVSRTSSRVHPGRPSAVVMLHRFGVSREYARWRADEIIALSRIDPEAKSKISLSHEHSAIRVPHGLRVNSIVDHQPDASLTDPMVLELSPSSSANTAGDDVRLRVKRRPDPPPARFIGCGHGLCYPPYREGPRLWGINTPPLFGLGRLEQVTLADVTAIAESQPPEIRGRAAILPDGRLGRFGWKAQHASLRDFNDEACAVELGVSTPTSRQAPAPRLHPTDDEDAASLFRQSDGSNPDISAHGVDALTAFVAALPQPRELVDTRQLAVEQRSNTAASVRMPAVPITSPVFEPRDVRAGRHIFQSIGCAVCHTPDNGPVSGVYSDLLLHDVGTETYYGSYFQRRTGEHAATPGEFRTPPLWGVADSAPYLHHGRAESLEQAIGLHAGQAESAVKKYCEELAPDQRRQLIAFLKNLKAPLP
jgi:CxxC motif-containing protein (DUF1111 family)